MYISNSLFLEPSFNLTSSVTTLTVLDVSPFNNLSLTCDASAPVKVLSRKTISWRVLKVGEQSLGTQIFDGYKGFRVMETEFLNGRIRSSVVGPVDQSGLFHYLCEATLNVLEDRQRSEVREIRVAVKGKGKIIAHLVVSLLAIMFAIFGSADLLVND